MVSIEKGAFLSFPVCEREAAVIDSVTLSGEASRCSEGGEGRKR